MADVEHDAQERAHGPRQISWRVRVLVATLAVGTWLLSIRNVPILSRLELNLSDLRFRLREHPAPSGHIALAVVDENSLDKLGRWPWPRTVLARLVRALSLDGARVIGFEMAFLEPDSRGMGDLLSRLDGALAAHGVEDAALLAEIQGLGAEADTDAALAAAIQESGAAVVLSYLLHMERSEVNYRVSPAEQAEREGRISGARYTLSKLPGGEERAPLPRIFAPQPSIAVLARATPHAGFLMVPTDVDGGVRRAPTAVEYRGSYYPSLAVQVAWNYFGRPFPLGIYGDEREVAEVELGRGRFYPTSEGGEVLINYLGPPGVFPRFSIADILEGKVPAGTFRDRVVLVGTTVKGITPHLQTPMHSFYPGVEVQATVVDNLIEGRVLERPAWFDFLDLLAILVPGCLCALLVGRLGVLTELVLVVLAAIGYLGVNFWLFWSTGVVVVVVYPLLAIAATYLSLTLHRYRQERSQRRQIADAFGRYVAPRVIEQMLADPGQLRLGGEERLVTVLFSDLSGFTAVSERLRPSEMVELMCEYFEEMTEKIYAQDGLLKEYVGDEIMAIFGAPLVQPDHAVRACRAALAMRDRLAELAARWVEEGRPPLSARWGVNSGVVLVGNLGSSYRYSYGALGDNVNLGSRLEGLNGQYGTKIMVGENTLELIGDEFHVRELDKVAVKGKAKGIRIYELIASAGEVLPPERVEANRVYAEGLAAYREQRWQQALARFEEVLGLLPEDGPARVLKGRAESYALDPPGADWDGVFVATKK